MTTAINQLVLFRSASSRYQAAVTVRIVTGDTADLLVLGDGTDWEDGVPAAYYARPMAGKAKGTTVDQWQPVDVTAEVGAAIATAVSGGLTGYASTSSVTSAIAAAVASLATAASVTSAIATAATYADTAIAAIPADDDSGLTVVAGAGTSHTGLGLNAVRQPSSTRPTRVEATGQIALTSTVLGPKTATVTLLSDASNPPTTPRGVQTLSLSGVAATVSVPWSLGYAVPAAHYYELVTSGADAAGVSLTAITETAG